MVATLAVAALRCAPVEPLPQQDETIVENVPGALVVTSPARASFVESDKVKVVEVRGTGATAALVVNGAKAEVAEDGSFRALVKPSVGLNVVVAQDGASRLETPFLYGHFASAERMVPGAIAIDIGAAGFSAPPPAASLTTITNLALRGRDLIAPMKGQTFSGSVVGATWSFQVTGGRHGLPLVAFSAGAGGPDVAATVRDVAVEGLLTIGALGFDTTRAISITVDRALVSGATALYVDEDKGELRADIPTASVTLDGFRTDANNFGFPCCVDSVMSRFLRPKVESTIRDGLREEIPKALALTLHGIGLPKTLDLSALGMKKAIAIESRLDGGSFDAKGATLSASVLFGGKPEPGSIGERAPGWLELGRRVELGKDRSAAFGASLSIDAVNQLLFAAWGTGALSIELTKPIVMKLAPQLPPFVSFADSGALRIGLGEVLASRNGEGAPFAAVSVVQEVVPTTEGDAVVLAPKGAPQISITWLTGGAPGSGNNAIADAAREQIARALVPMRFPLPRLALDALGAGFSGQFLGVSAPTLGVDAATARVSAAGSMVLLR